MTEVSLNNTYIVNPTVAVRHIQNELFFITPATAQLHNMSEQESDIWNCIIQGWSPSQIIDKLVTDTDGTPEVVTQDILELFSHLVEKGILQPAP